MGQAVAQLPLRQKEAGGKGDVEFTIEYVKLIHRMGHNQCLEKN